MDPMTALNTVKGGQSSGVSKPEPATQSATVVSPALSVAKQPATAKQGGISPADQAADSQSSIEQLKESVDNANAKLSSMNQRVDLAVDQETGRIVVKVSNTSTGEVVSQIPSESALKLAKSLDSLTGILVDKKS